MGAAEAADETTTYYTGDTVGSERMMTSAQGYPVWQAMYAPFGTEISPQITVNSWKFAGTETDSESGLNNAEFRQYSSIVHRWLSPDPLGGDITAPQSLNRYAYALNSPTNSIDPSGLGPKDSVCDSASPLYGPCNGGVSFTWTFLDSGHYGLWQECVLDGIDTPCPEVRALEDSGAADECTLGICSGVGRNGTTAAFFRFVSTLEGSGYEELSEPISTLPSPEQLAKGINNQLLSVIDGLRKKGATDRQVNDFLTAVIFQYNNGGIPLVGGNFEFASDYAKTKQPIFANDFGCFAERCALSGWGLSTLDFSHTGTVHLDSGDPYYVPLGSIAHGVVDMGLGHWPGWVEIIPR